MEGAKQCNRCEFVMPLERFTRYKKDGSYLGHCKKCAVKKNKSWREDHKKSFDDHRKKYMKEYRSIERVRDKYKKRRETESYKSMFKIWWDANKSRINEKRRLSTKELDSRWVSSLVRARLKKIEDPPRVLIELTELQVLLKREIRNRKNEKR